MEILFIVAAVVVLGFFVYILLQKNPKKEDNQEIVKADPVSVVPQEPKPMNEESVESPVEESSPEEAIEELEKELEDDTTEEDPLV